MQELLSSEQNHHSPCGIRQAPEDGWTLEDGPEKIRVWLWPKGNVALCLCDCMFASHNILLPKVLKILQRNYQSQKYKHRIATLFWKTKESEVSRIRDVSLRPLLSVTALGKQRWASYFLNQALSSVFLKDKNGGSGEGRAIFKPNSPASWSVTLSKWCHLFNLQSPYLLKGILICLSHKIAIGIK